MGANKKAKTKTEITLSLDMEVVARLDLLSRKDSRTRSNLVNMILKEKVMGFGTGPDEEEAII